MSNHTFLSSLCLPYSSLITISKTPHPLFLINKRKQLLSTIFLCPI